jgi:hypothetical protein
VTAQAIEEGRLQQIERELAASGPHDAAAVAFAAIMRIGELGAPATAAFGRLADGVFADPDFSEFAIGFTAVADLLRGEAARG